MAREEFTKMEQLGIIRPPSLPWASPLHMAPKASGGWRPCGDYRLLNQITTSDRYPVPHIQSFNERLANTCIYSKLDLIRSYHQIPVHPDSIPKTAVTTPFRLWEFVRTPFGLKNAGQTFQRLMDSMFRDLDYVFVYMDDILVASESVAAHEQHLQQVFTILSQNGMVLNKSKCELGVDNINFLAHHVSNTGIRPTPERVSAIKEYPQP